MSRKSLWQNYTGTLMGHCQFPHREVNGIHAHVHIHIYTCIAYVVKTMQIPQEVCQQPIGLTTTQQTIPLDVEWVKVRVSFSETTVRLWVTTRNNIACHSPHSAVWSAVSKNTITLDCMQKSNSVYRHTV